MGTLLLIIGLLMFVGLVVLHELGHAIVARRNKVGVEEFGIGFPPRAWGKKLKNGTFFSLNWLPLGGFVRLKGEHDSAEGPGTYGGASLWAKTKILLAGVVVNWLTAVVIFTILALIGLPKILPDQFTVAGDTHIAQNSLVAAQIGESSPAQKAGLQQGDTLLRFAGQDVKNADQFRELTKSHAGKTVPVSFTRGNETKEVSVTLNKDSANGQGYIGIGLAEQTLQRSTWSAPIVGLGVTTQFTIETFKGLATVITHLFKSEFAQAGQNVAGPVGIFSILKTSSDLGIIPVLFLIGIISLTLAVMNVLPIPALDGGRLFVTLIFRALKQPLTKKREEAIQAAGFVALMALVILITIVDVGRFF